MIEITEFIKKYMAALDQAFPDRVWFAGLQGSYGREEATEASDIDMVGILDQLSASDIHTYDAMLDTLPCRELICGFLSGRQELENWGPCFPRSPSRIRRWRKRSRGSVWRESSPARWTRRRAAGSSTAAGLPVNDAGRSGQSCWKWSRAIWWHVIIVKR